MKLITILISLVIITLVFRVIKPNHKYKDVYVPFVEMGYQHNICAMHVCDNQGAEFVINYKDYWKLFTIGGYNKIVQTYYTNPSVCHRVDGFYRVYDDDADLQKKKFYNSYMATLKHISH
jgi:hypothetical protein